MTDHSENIVCEAIRKRLLLTFDYDGLLRVVAPYCHGTSTRGVASLRAVQVSGSSRSGGLGFGKLWSLSKMRNLQLTNETFVPDDPNYNPNDSGMREIHCRI